jgi:hypothetical protein
MTPKQNVLEARPGSVCYKSLRHYEVRTSEGEIIGRSLTASDAWRHAWRKIGTGTSSPEPPPPGQPERG